MQIQPIEKVYTGLPMGLWSNTLCAFQSLLQFVLLSAMCDYLPAFLMAYTALIVTVCPPPSATLFFPSDQWWCHATLISALLPLSAPLTFQPGFSSPQSTWQGIQPEHMQLAWWSWNAFRSQRKVLVELRSNPLQFFLAANWLCFLSCHLRYRMLLWIGPC